MVAARDIEYSVDGMTMSGRLALPDGTGQRPAVLIVHEGNGLDEFQRPRPERLAGPQDSGNIRGKVPGLIWRMPYRSRREN